MGGISLTASMRSNLLSLQTISGQVSSTQNKLATGNKVNSAIDNPGSYYTALSLNNRADDLNALLDSMGQAVSTIKAATTALESASEFLEQASAVATQALETAIPSKESLQNLVGKNGAVVTTAEELREAVNSGKETICVYGHIDLGDISTAGGLELKSNQKLVGVGYFGDYDSDTNKFSAISATANTAKDLIILGGTNSLVSDLSINYNNTTTAEATSAIYIYDRSHGQNENALQNLDVVADFSTSDVHQNSAIRIAEEEVVTIGGKINIQTSGASVSGIRAANQASITIQKEANINIDVRGTTAIGISAWNQSTLNVQSMVDINIQGTVYRGVDCNGNSQVNIDKNTNLTIKNSLYGLWAEQNSHITVGGDIYFDQQPNGIAMQIFRGSVINVGSNAKVYIANTNGCFNNRQDAGEGSNILNIAAGAKIATEKDGKTDWYEVKEEYHDENTSATDNNITAYNIKDKLNIETTSAWALPETAEIDFDTDISEDEANQQTLIDAGQNYKEIINQYDALIKDASYKGINLLQADKLTVKFNETNSASLDVQGQDMSSQSLGFKTFDWQTQGDIADSLAEIADALKGIRSYSAELGNNYSIITTRQDFTESLVNVLTEGADKLTLADMNEESANMLALQTRQQLAINSLSLASQASQSILKLF